MNVLNRLGYVKPSLLKFNYKSGIKLFNQDNHKSASTIIASTDQSFPKLSKQDLEDKKKIFKKKAHYRSLKLDNRLDPPKNFQELDDREMLEYQKRQIFDKTYMRVMSDWQNNMADKRRRKQVTLTNLENYVKPEPMNEKFIVHNQAKEISIPPKDENLFAVVQFKGLQHKVLKDDLVMMERMDLKAGDFFTFDKVLLVATDEYTSIGRPYVQTAKVLAQVESNELTDKVIVFKKKRRKGYQKNQGHRQLVTMIRIVKVVHKPDEATLNNYTSLI